MSLSESLRRLPDFDPPAGGWPALSRRLDARRRHRPRLLILAAAASALLAVSMTLHLPTLAPDRGAPLRASAADLELIRLMERSRELELQLAQLRPQTTVWDARLQAHARELQRGLAYVDLQLTHAQGQGQPEQARQLWSNRVELMAALVAAHRDAHLVPGDAFHRSSSI